MGGVVEIKGQKVEVLDPVPGVGAQARGDDRVIDIGSLTRPRDMELWVQAGRKQAAIDLLLEVIIEGGNPNLYLGC